MKITKINPIDKQPKHVNYIKYETKVCDQSSNYKTISIPFGNPNMATIRKVNAIKHTLTT